MPDRQRVEEFVGDQQQPPGWQRLDALDKMRLGDSEPALLLGAQNRARFDEVQPERLPKRRQGRGGAQEVLHQRAAPRPQLGQDDRIGPADPLPQIGAPQPDQLAENLADLGGGGEIAGAAEWLVPRVIAAAWVVQGHRHEGRDRERPMPADMAGDAGAEIGGAHPQAPRRRAHWPATWLRGAATATGRLHAHRINKTPAINSGIDSSWPIVVPNTRKPSCTSGWRNNSPDIRATA